MQILWRSICPWFQFDTSCTTQTWKIIRPIGQEELLICSVPYMQTNVLQDKYKQTYPNQTPGKNQPSIFWETWYFKQFRSRPLQYCRSDNIFLILQGQKPFECEVCKQRFVTKCNLINHEWQHKQVRSRPFKCQLCRKAYLRQNLLDAHMRSHRGVKPFVCNECGLQFANKSNWQRHVAEHSGARNFCCPRCDKRFSRGYYLTDHMKTHTGEKPYACGICGKTAATRSNYNSHLRTHITREPVNSEV